jgi:hypothetical protein
MAELPKPIAHTVDAIYRAYEARPEYERAYLGASVIGAECVRQLFYAFRWAHAPERLDGRKLRLFQTGHREEARLIDDLRAAGMMVMERDPATGEQWAIASIGGHFRGHLDGLVSGVLEAPVVEHVLECKTHGDKSFKALLKDGVAKSKPAHYAQMQIYMHHMKLDRAFYIAVNKNDDALYTERVEYDKPAAEQLMKRAERIIRADHAPPKLHEDPTSKTAFACIWCAARAVCHEGEFARRNCRTCISSTPVVDESDGGVWRCEHWGKELSYEEQQAGCSAHRLLPSLVPGEQIDASEDERTITYLMRDGSEWVDGGAA